MSAAPAQVTEAHEQLGTKVRYALPAVGNQLIADSEASAVAECERKQTEVDVLLIGICSERDDLRAKLAKERARFPSDMEQDLVEVFSQEGNPVFVSGIKGKTNGDMVQKIEKDLNERRDFMDMGDGLYLYKAVYEPAQTDEWGRVELPGYWDLSFVAFAAMKESK